MQVESFRVFRDLVETRSFSRSASLNGITQSAVSQQLRSIEVRLRVPLLERTSKQFALTREGQLLYEASREIIGYYQRFQHQLEEMRNIISGTIRLVAVPSLGLHELPPYIKDFLKAFPQVKIQVAHRRVRGAAAKGALGGGLAGRVARDREEFEQDHGVPVRCRCADDRRRSHSAYSNPARTEQTRCTSAGASAPLCPRAHVSTVASRTIVLCIAPAMLTIASADTASGSVATRS